MKTSLVKIILILIQRYVYIYFDFIIFLNRCFEYLFYFKENTDYNVCILKQVQAIFAHLHYSKLQYYIPRGLWAHFKLVFFITIKIFS